MPVRLICQPYFCLRKIAGLGLPVTNCQTLKFSVVLLPVTAICQWQIAAEYNCQWYICQRKAMGFLEHSNLLLRLYLLNVGPYLRYQGTLKDPRAEFSGTRHMKAQSNLRPILTPTLLGVWTQPGTLEMPYTLRAILDHLVF